MLVPNASPFERDKTAQRDMLLAQRVQETGVAVAYLNAVGGQDELVFDGASVLADGDGGVHPAARAFEDHWLVADFDPANPSGEQQLDGQARVDGVSLGVAGELTDRWSVFANATLLDSEVLQSVSDYCLANPGLNGCTNTPANPDPQRGQRIINTPEQSASLWTTYAFAPGWSAGYGVTYQGGFDGGRVIGLPDVKSHTTHRAMLAWDVNEKLALQLNANNLFDKQYFTRVRNNGWATPGEARSAVLSATYRF